MSITVLERLEDGTIKNHNDAAKPRNENADGGQDVNDVATEVVASAEEGGR